MIQIYNLRTEFQVELKIHDLFFSNLNLSSTSEEQIFKMQLLCPNTKVRR